MTRPGSIAWFARHEARLAWRDWLSLMTGGQRRRGYTVALGIACFAALVHGLAWLMLASSTHLTGAAGKYVLVSITGTLLLSGSMVLSQAIEFVTRGFYARGDLDLILTSPAAVSRLFAVRIVTVAATVVLMSLVLGGPFINVLAWFGGMHWLAAYAVVVALGMDAVAISVALTVGLFRAIGPRRTRFIAQVVAAVVGAAFVIVVQFVAIVSHGGSSTTAEMQMAALIRLTPASDSAIWWPARAVIGDPVPLVTLVILSVAALALAIYLFAPSFGRLALATVNVTPGATRHGRLRTRFHNMTQAQALRRKEWILLLRDPWLISQTLMQLLFLLPAAFLLWRDFYGDGRASSAMLVPLLIVAAGQLGGGLAWLAVSGEDAPGLIASAPVSAACVSRAKAEAVLGGIAVIFCPLIAILAFTAPFAALVALAGVAIAAGSATMIQYWFRTQAKRGIFRRRQTSSRVATFAEALSSIGWAGTGALAATGSWLAVVPGLLVLAVVAGAWMISPARGAAVV